MKQRWYGGFKARRIGWHNSESWIPDPRYGKKPRTDLPTDAAEACYALDNYKKPHHWAEHNCVKCGQKNTRKENL